MPQLREVDERVHALDRFHIEPVPGLVPTRDFYGALADRTFLSTQYIRHHSAPFYTPEPDIVHEIIGHANMLANPTFADLYEEAGKASRPGYERRRARLLLQGLLVHARVRRGAGGRRAARPTAPDCCRRTARSRSSATAEIRPWDIARMGTLEYDITRYQPVLFAAESFDRMVDDLTGFFAAYDDEARRRWTAGP